MFTKGRILKNQKGVLTVLAVHAETGREVEIKFSRINAFLIVGTEMRSMPKSAKLWACLRELDKMAKNAVN